MLVEDEEELRELWKQFLEQHGFRVIAAKNGLDGLHLWAEHQDNIALVVTDLHMPIMDGAVMVRRIRAIQPDAKVLVVSSDQSISREGAALLPKPFALNELLAKVRLLCA